MNKYIYWVCLLAASFCFWYLNDAIPFMADDCYNYDHVFPMVEPGTYLHGMDTARVAENISDIIESQYNHWFVQSGRTVVHFIDQCFCVLWGKDAYNVFAAILFALYILLFGEIGFNNCNNKRWGGFFAIALLGVCALEPIMYYNGCSFGCNYLLSPVLILGFLYCFLKAKQSSIIINALICFIAFFAGWSHEGLVIPIGAYTLLYAFQNWKRLSKSQFAVGICFGLGSLMLIFAPANMNKTGGMGLSLTFGPVFENIRIFWIFLITIALVLWKKRLTLINYLKSEFPWLGALLIALLFSIFIGVTYPRALIGIELMSLVCICRLLVYIPRIDTWIRYGGVVGAIVIISGLSLITHYQRIWTPRYQAAREEVSNSADPVQTVIVKFDDAPKWLEPYLCGKFNEFDLFIYGWMYNKEKLVFLEEEDAKRLVPSFVGEDKMPGKNPFYKVGDYIITTEEENLSLGFDSLKQLLPVKMHLGSFTWFTWEARVKKIASLIKKPGSNELNVELPLDTMRLNGIDYYRYYMYPFPSRKIEAIDVISE